MTLKKHIISKDKKYFACKTNWPQKKGLKVLFAGPGYNSSAKGEMTRLIY
jgi:hypothetical protein